jgi:hypothetical protein
MWIYPLRRTIFELKLLIDEDKICYSFFYVDIQH